MYVPKGWTPTASEISHRVKHDYTLSEALKHLAMVCALVPAVSEYLRGHFDHLAGSPDFSGVDGRDRGRGGGHGWYLVSIGNALGRVFWAWVSDLVTRRATFVIMFVVQAVLFWFLPSIADGLADDDRRVRRADVLRRRVWHDAGLCR